KWFYRSTGTHRTNLTSTTHFSQSTYGLVTHRVSFPTHHPLQLIVFVVRIRLSSEIDLFFVFCF
ncbi:hypothetical protein HD806DRAFT_495447, partial [Xylariaceae sp. AK1471]